MITTILHTMQRRGKFRLHNLPESISLATIIVRMRFSTFFLLFLLPLPKAWSADYRPFPLLLLDDYFSHHIVIAEKSTNTLYLYRNDKGNPVHLKSYKMATGKKPGNKLFEGDHRTPEGIYLLTDFIPRQKLLERYGKEGEMYGVGAFVSDYPNPIDLLNKKTGSGIWLHSTNDETRIEKGLDSRGCVVTANQHLIDISSYIELHKTLILIVQNLSHLKEDTWKKIRNKLQKTLQDWSQAWERENPKQYFSHYHKNFFDPQKGNLDQFKFYKKNIFRQPGKPKINISHVNITQNKKYAVISFLQDYHSGVINDTGKKTLYLVKDEYYNWKIIAEKWSKNGIHDDKKRIAFKPHIRFFKTNNPDEILKKSKN